MEIEKIVSTVQEKVGNTDFSAQTIRKCIELYPVADGSEPDEAYFSKVADFVKGMQGQYNHDFSTKFTEAKKNLFTEDTIKSMSEEQIADFRKLLDGLKPNHVEPAKESEEVTALKAEIAKLTERLDNNDKAKRQSEILQRVKNAMRDQKANDEYVLENALRGVEIDVEKTEEELTKEMLAKYDAEYLRCRGAGAPPRQGMSGQGGQGETWLDKQFAKKAAREGWGK